MYLIAELDCGCKVVGQLPLCLLGSVIFPSSNLPVADGDSVADETLVAEESLVAPLEFVFLGEALTATMENPGDPVEPLKMIPGMPIFQLPKVSAFGSSQQEVALFQPVPPAEQHHVLLEQRYTVFTVVPEYAAVVGHCWKQFGSFHERSVQAPVLKD